MHLTHFLLYPNTEGHDAILLKEASLCWVCWFLKKHLGTIMGLQSCDDEHQLK